MPIDPTSPLRKAIEALRVQLDRAASEIDALVEQRHLIATAPPAREDMYRAIDEWTDREAARYRKPLRELLEGMINAPMLTDSLMSDPARPWFGRPLSLATGQHERLDGPAVHHGAMCLAAGELIRAALKAEADALLAGQPQGLPLDQRRQKLSELDSLISEKKSALAAMKSEAQAAGLSIA
jgi:hypothetical protein